MGYMTDLLDLDEEAATVKHNDVLLAVAHAVHAGNQVLAMVAEAAVEEEELDFEELDLDEDEDEELFLGEEDGVLLLFN